jgi:hypothetical protein
MKEKMDQKRFSKIDTFIKDVFTEDFYWYEIINNKASKFFVSFWINKLVLQWFIEDKPEYWIIILKVFQPLDMRLQKVLDEHFMTDLIFVEQNYSWQLEKLIKNNFKLHHYKTQSIRINNLYPIFEEQIWDQI